MRSKKEHAAIGDRAGRRQRSYEMPVRLGPGASTGSASDQTIRKTATGIRIEPDKRFFRLDESFSDAVRSGKKSKVTNVLLRADLSGELAARTAKKILPDRRRR